MVTFKRKKKKEDGNDFFDNDRDEDIFERDPFMNNDMGKMMDDMLKNMTRMMGPGFSDMIREVEKGVSEAQKNPGKPIRIDIKMTRSPTGEAIIQRRVNNQEFGQNPNVREPLVDVLEKDKTITILAELPGVNKKDIDVNVGKDKKSVIIEVTDKFYKEVALPCEVKEQGQTASYKNGVLEVNLDKKIEPKVKMKKKSIKVE